MDPAEAGPVLGLRLHAMGRYTNPAELRFAGCADQHGHDPDFEPDRASCFDREFQKNPDFLIARDGFEVIVEVRDFETRVLDHVQKRLFTALP
ncbi:MAG TPA: hypothetical protein VGC49_01095 [Solirubrobacterales bacterium]